MKFAIYYYGPNRKQRHGADLIGHLEMTGKDYTKLLVAMRDQLALQRGHYPEDQKFFYVTSDSLPTGGGWPTLRRVVTKAMKDSIEYRVGPLAPSEPLWSLRGIIIIIFSTRKRKRIIDFLKDGRSLYLSIVQV